MKMADLVSYGYPAGLIKIWEKEESPDLLPLREEAITKYDLLAKALRNLLVIAPTSSGKTFIGELAAVKQALEMRRALFLVPYRAIAEEQFANFQSKYKDYGLRIAISDRDHREYDDDIIAGEYEIAIIVYEKFVGLMVQNPELVNGCGVVIVDEVQMMMDRERGPTIELLLTKLLLLQPPVRLIALSAVLDKLNGFDEWLKAAVLRSELRPVELREGVYTPEGNVRYREFNSKQRGTEQLNPWDGRQGALVT